VAEVGYSTHFEMLPIVNSFINTPRGLSYNLAH